MVVAFFGHADFCGTESQKEKIFEYLNALTEGKPAEMYLGGYGGFDRFAHGCCKRYQALCRGISLIFVSPYVVDGYRKERLEEIRQSYDSVIYPAIEDKPQRYAIVYRNRWMVEQADACICAVERRYGGAYQALCYAKRLKKPIFNLLENG